MSAGEWIAIVAIVVTVCLTIGGATIAIRVQIARLESAVNYLTEALKEFRSSVDEEHREMWRAIYRRDRAVNDQ